MNPTDRYFELIKGKKPTNDIELYDILFNYIQSRIQELNLNTKIKLFFRETEFTSQTDERGKRISKTTVYNPKTKENSNRELSNGAFYDPSNNVVYVAFDIREKPENFIQNMVFFTHHLNHELQHAVQTKRSNEEISYRSFLISRDLQILKYIDSSFYHKGHDGFYIEQDANEASFTYLENELKKRGIISKEILELINYLKETTTISTKADITTNLNIFGLKVLEEDKTQKQQNISGQSEKVITLLTDILQRNPNTKGTNPVYEYIYNADGTKLTYCEIKKMIMANPSLISLYQDLIKNDPLLQIQKLEDELIFSYFKNGNDKNKKEAIINQYLTKIKGIVSKEKIDIQNLLVFFDKRLEELANSRMYPNKTNEIQLLSLLAKQTILENKTIQYVDKKMHSYQTMFNSYSVYVEKKFHFVFEGKTRDQLINELNTLANSITNANEKQVIQVLISILSYQGYSAITQKKETKKGSLYETPFYQQNESKGLDFNLFEIANEIYMNSKQYIRTYDNGAYSVIDDDPLLNNIINSNPNIIELFNNILASNPGKEISDKLNIAINICNQYIRKQPRK